MKDTLYQIKEDAFLALQKAKDEDELKQIRVKYLGKKGKLTSVLRGMGKLPASDRPIIGKLANEIRDEIQDELDRYMDEISNLKKEEQLAREAIDITLPGRVIPRGSRHPINTIMNEIKEIFVGLGYSIAEGPEVELDYYNFEALNIPKDHPARDLQDTFYISDEVLLRTQTSPVQVRVMENSEPPIRIIAPGKVYRCDADVTHSPMFHQVEGLVVDDHITFGDLKGTLIYFVHELFGKDRGVRFRPHYFPFTEPSAEVDISCIICDGKGCRLCSNSGWLEILGAGMVHPRVLEMVDYDPDEVGGFAFGLGVERIAMLKYGVDDIRLFFENDMRLMKQF